MSDFQVLKKLPAVMALSRSFVVSDAVLTYGAKDVDGKEVEKPVYVLRHGIRGTQNVNEQKTDDATNADSERKVSNIQEIESAKTGSDMLDLRIAFNFKTLPLSHRIDSCTGHTKKASIEAEKMRDMLTDFIARALNSDGLQEVCLRIARNILNARWTWRNRTISSRIKVLVFEGDKALATVNDALKIPMHTFDTYSAEEHLIANLLAEDLRGENKHVLNIKAVMDLGITGSTEVFCSQNFEPKRKNAKKEELSKVLYKIPLMTKALSSMGEIVGQAAYRDAKVWNALRTFDTWYDDYAEVGIPIAVEPVGASLSDMNFHRTNQSSMFDMLKRLHQISPDSPEGMYCIASIMRGGVFSESDKKKVEE